MYVLFFLREREKHLFCITENKKISCLTMVVHGEWDYGHMTVVTPPTREKKKEKKKNSGKGLQIFAELPSGSCWPILSIINRTE